MFSRLRQDVRELTIMINSRIFIIVGRKFIVVRDIFRMLYVL